MAARPLTAKQRQTAMLCGNGASKTDAAKAVGVSRRSVQAWAADPEGAWQTVMRQARSHLLDEQPNARSVLEQALTATDRQGHPLWRDRINAARALTGLGGGGKLPEPEAREIVFHTNGDDPDPVDEDVPGVGINRTN